MRARSIKPSLFKNELLGTADPLYTILFEGLWCLADREGRLEDRPLRIRAEVFPYRQDCDVDSQLRWLDANKFIRRYEVNGLKVIQILAFSEHQHPHKNEVPSALPKMDEVLPAKARSTSGQGKKRAQPYTASLRLTPSSLTPDSGLLTPDCLMVPSEPLSDAKPPDDVREVFDHWRSTWNHPQAALTDKRRAVIRRALRDYAAATLRETISGYRNSPHHCGQNERSTVYDSIELFLRDAAHIDTGLRFARAPPVLTSPTTQHNVTVLQDWKPPEARDENSGYAEISGHDGEPRRCVHADYLAPDH